ncbi:MAG: hypothetical protein V3V96_06610 [Acidiferrobacterales bacterium]
MSRLRKFHITYTPEGPRGPAAHLFVEWYETEQFNPYAHAKAMAAELGGTFEEIGE